MRLTKFTDYALRVLILAASTPGRNITVTEAADFFGVSAPHLKKVVRTLSREGFLQGTRGRSGGFQLGLAPEDIKLGAVIRITEPDFAMVECFTSENACAITPICKLPRIIDRALLAMLEVFDGFTLADISIAEDLRLAFPVPDEPRGGTPEGRPDGAEGRPG